MPSEQLGKGEVPSGVNCEFCGSRRATRSHQFMRKIKGGKAGAKAATGMFIYTCDTCKDIGERAVEKPRPAL